MISNILENRIVFGIAIVLALIISSEAEEISPQLGEILGMNMVFPIVVAVILFILVGVLSVIKMFLPPNTKKGKNS